MQYAPIHSSALICMHSPGFVEVTYYSCASWGLFCGIHFFEDSVHDEGCKEEGADVGDGLGDLDSQKADGRCQDQQCRDQEESLATDGDQCGTDTVADGLRHHISHGDHTLQGKGDKLKSQCQCTDTDNIGITFSE